MGPVQIDALTEICHGTPFDEDHYIFDGNDAQHGAAGGAAAALPLRPHPPAGDLQDGRPDSSFEGDAPDPDRETVDPAAARRAAT